MLSRHGGCAYNLFALVYLTDSYLITQRVASKSGQCKELQCFSISVDYLQKQAHFLPHMGSKTFCIMSRPILFPTCTASSEYVMQKNCWYEALWFCEPYHVQVRSIFIIDLVWPNSCMKMGNKEFRWCLAKLTKYVNSLLQ